MRAVALPGGLEAGRTCVENLLLQGHGANIGTVRSLVIHRASTTHSQLISQEQRDTGVTLGLVRLSVGVEALRGIPGDLELGFAAVDAAGLSGLMPASEPGAAATAAQIRRIGASALNR